MSSMESFVNSTLVLPIEEQPAQVMNDLAPVMTIVAAAAAFAGGVAVSSALVAAYDAGAD
ncbi:hypothetical protein [Streptomyces fuscichromogenes]|uniref:Uncharacterized protein n=1 Tax=Streptomyces fuscichromogenes TaxID=1324013 RepID=A0A918CT96_9ACTN|nr:hypothetical protein [Streptomyces fuscichromogenes]GGN19658.1 hypothetical protein GCM10011578_049650 [Streptomyces fuscichromogenes]